MFVLGWILGCDEGTEGTREDVRPPEVDEGLVGWFTWREHWFADGASDDAEMRIPCEVTIALSGAGRSGRMRGVRHRLRALRRGDRRGPERLLGVVERQRGLAGRGDRCARRHPERLRHRAAGGRRRAGPAVRLGRSWRIRSGGTCFPPSSPGIPTTRPSRPIRSTSCCRSRGSTGIARDQELCFDGLLADVPTDDAATNESAPGRLDCLPPYYETRDVWEVDAPRGSVVVVDRLSAEDAPVILWVDDADGCVTEYGLTNAPCPGDPLRVCSAVHLPASGPQRVYLSMLGSDYCGGPLDYRLRTDGVATLIESGTPYNQFYDTFTTATFEMTPR